MTKPVWPHRASRQPETRTDPAPAALTRIADAIEARADDVLRGRAQATHDRPQRRGLPLMIDDLTQVWQSDEGDGIDVWCAIAGGGARALLEIVLAGPAAPKPTALERSIMRETMERLLGSSGRAWEERAAQHLPTAIGWVCTVCVAAPLGERGVLTLYAPSLAQPPAPIAAHVDVRHVPVTLTASLPPIGVRVDTIVGWKHGTVVALSCSPNVAVGLYAGSLRVAAGRLGVARAKRAVKIDGPEPEGRR